MRRIVDVSGADLSADFDGRPLGMALLAPTRIYVKPVLDLLRTVPVKGLAHITGGGITENVPRVLPANVVADLRLASWELPPVFQWLQKQGRVADAEMHRVFNCGIGMVPVVSAADADRTVAHLNAAGETAWIVGDIRARNGDEAQTLLA